MDVTMQVALTCDKPTSFFFLRLEFTRNPYIYNNISTHLKRTMLTYLGKLKVAYGNLNKDSQ